MPLPPETFPPRLQEIRERLRAVSAQPWQLPPDRPDATCAALLAVGGNGDIQVPIDKLLEAVPDTCLDGELEQDFTCDAEVDVEAECPECGHQFVRLETCGKTHELRLPYVHELTAGQLDGTWIDVSGAACDFEPVFANTADRELVRWAVSDLEYLLALVENAGRIFVGSVERMPVYVDRIDGGWTLMSGAQAVGTEPTLAAALDRAVRFVKAGNGTVLLPNARHVGV